MKYKVRCLNCKYDEENEMLVVLAFCEDFGEQRIFTIPRSDFHYKKEGVVAPVNEMLKLAQTMKGKRFVWDLRDDPNKTVIPEGKQDQIEAVYKENLEDQLDEIAKGLASADRRTITRLADVVERDRKRKDEHPPTEQDILDEIMMRDKLKEAGW